MAKVTSDTDIARIKWSDSVWFSDVDDTLVNTAAETAAASEGIKDVFRARFGEETARKIQEEFNSVFNIMLAGLRNKTEDDWLNSSIPKTKFEEVWAEVEKYQMEIKQKFGSIKKFSREVFIKVCIDKVGINSAPELIYEAADAYWVKLSEKIVLLPGVEHLVKEIKKHGRPLYLVTSSDARLKMNANGQFEYVPSYSENFKRERVQLLREKGLDFNVVSIGDPEDKPSEDFFLKGIRAAEEDLGEKIELSNAIIMGDSYAADLQTPKERMGFGLVVLFDEGRKRPKLVDKHQITTGNLFDVANYLT